MGLVTSHTQHVEIPGEDESAQIRSLSLAEMKEAERDALVGMGAIAKSMPVEMLTQAREARKAEGGAREEGPLDGVDPITVLRYGVVSWTYDVSVAEGVLLLDAKTATYLAEQIMVLTRGGESKKGS